MWTAVTPDGKPHLMYDTDDVAEVIRKYAGDDIAEIVKNTIDEHTDEYCESLEQEFHAYEADLDSKCALLHEVRAMIEDVVIHEIETKKRMDRSILYKRLMQIDQMIYKEL